jgi:RNA polymerase sigma factor (TIGR02999 family)
MPIVYGQLHSLARGYLLGERPGHTLQSTALVNEVYLKLAGGHAEPRDRGHFMAIAARAMRQILIDHARGKQRQKRGATPLAVTLDEAVALSPHLDESILDLDQALTQLAARDARKAQIVEMIYFGGLSHQETAAALEIAPVTLHRELTLAKAWLARRLKGSPLAR